MLAPLACRSPRTFASGEIDLSSSAARWIPGAPTCQQACTSNPNLTARTCCALETGYDLDGYGRSQRIAGIERGTPLSLERFLDYSDWYIKHLVPDVSDVTVTEIKAVNGGFQVSFADARR